MSSRPRLALARKRAMAKRDGRIVKAAPKTLPPAAIPLTPSGMKQGQDGRINTAPTIGDSRAAQGFNGANGKGFF